jgi:hypothetical protein
MLHGSRGIAQSAKPGAQGEKRTIGLTLCAKRHAPCAFPLAAGGKTVKPGGKNE